MRDKGRAQSKCSFLDPILQLGSAHQPLGWGWQVATARKNSLLREMEAAMDQELPEEGLWNFDERSSDDSSDEGDKGERRTSAASRCTYNGVPADQRCCKVP